MLQLFRQLGAQLYRRVNNLMSNLSPGTLSGSVFSVPCAPASGVAEPVSLSSDSNSFSEFSSAAVLTSESLPLTSRRSVRLCFSGARFSRRSAG